MLSKAPRYTEGILVHAQAVDTRPTSLSEMRPGIEANAIYKNHTKIENNLLYLMSLS